MKKLILSFMIVGVIFVMSCNNDDDDPNRPPDSFEVTVSEITAVEATIEWEGTGDPDDDVLTYEVTFEGTVVSRDIGNGGTIKLTLIGLTASTEYSGFVTADDGQKNGTTDAIFSFTTLAEGE